MAKVEEVKKMNSSLDKMPISKEINQESPIKVEVVESQREENLILEQSNLAAGENQ